MVGRKYWRSIIYVTVLVIGLAILMNSLNWGGNEANSILASDGHPSMDTNTYLVDLAQAIAKYRVLGAVLAIFFCMSN